MPRATARTATSEARLTLARFWRLLRGGQASPGRLAASSALGLFIGCLPLYGLHFPLCLGACLLLRLDLVVAYLAANVSNPFVAPFLITAEVEVGSLLLYGQHAAFDVERARKLGVAGFLLQAAAGSLVVGALLALLGGGAVFAFARRSARDRRHGADAAPGALAARSQLEAAIERTVARYRAAPIGDRFYVSGKLRHDPVLARIAALAPELGDVVDAGAGRGQLGLCLLELGRVQSLQGFDSDARKVGLARAAAGSEAVFGVGDLGSAELPESDTILLVDVLHYLPAAEQDVLIARAAARVRPGGRLLIRDVDGSAGPRGKLTRLLEHLARLTGWHRGRTELCFRPLGELLRSLESQGLACRVLEASEGTPFANVLVVAERARS